MKSLVDYYGDSSEPNSELSFQAVKKYWLEVKLNESGLGYQWSMKDQTLLSRLMKEYPTDKIIVMMEDYLRLHPTHSFGTFFREREETHYKLFKPRNYGFD